MVSGICVLLVGWLVGLYTLYYFWEIAKFLEQCSTGRSLALQGCFIALPASLLKLSVVWLWGCRRAAALHPLSGAVVLHSACSAAAGAWHVVVCFLPEHAAAAVAWLLARGTSFNTAY